MRMYELIYDYDEILILCLIDFYGLIKKDLFYVLKKMLSLKMLFGDLCERKAKTIES